MRKFNSTILAMVLTILAMFLTGCETMQEMRNMPQPKTFVQSLAMAQGQIAALRVETAFIVRANNEDCQATPFSDLCTAARQINKKTHEYRDMIDQVKVAYDAVDGQLNQCQIEYAGILLDCQSTEDRVLAGLITLRKLLPQGTKQ